MTRLLFEEVQYFRDNRWLVTIILALMLGILVPVIYGAWIQLVLGEPWGNQPMTSRELMVLSMTMIATVAIVAFMLLSMKLEVNISTDGVSYRFFPLVRKWKTIDKRDILNYNIEKKWISARTGATGYHHNRFTKSISIKVSGFWHLYLELPKGRKLYLGTRQPENVKYAMRQLLKDDFQ